MAAGPEANGNEVTDNEFLSSDDWEILIERKRRGFRLGKPLRALGSIFKTAERQKRTVRFSVTTRCFAFLKGYLRRSSTASLVLYCAVNGQLLALKQSVIHDRCNLPLEV